MRQVHPEHPAASDCCLHCWTSPTSSQQSPEIHTQGFHLKYPHLAPTREGEQLETTPSKDPGVSNPIKWRRIQHKGNFFTGDLPSVTHLGWVWGTQSQGGAGEAAAVTPHQWQVSRSAGLHLLQRGNHTHPHHQNQSAPISCEHFPCKPHQAAQNSRGIFQ